MTNTSGGTRTGSDVAGGGAGDANAPSLVVTQGMRARRWMAELPRDQFDLLLIIVKDAREAERERCAQICQTRGAKALAAVIRRGE